MDQPALDPHEANPESLRTLVGEYVNRHSGIENYVVYSSIEFWLLRRLGIAPLSWPGRLAGGLIHCLMVLLPALILTAMTGQWADAPLLSWTIVAVA